MSNETIIYWILIITLGSLLYFAAAKTKAEVLYLQALALIAIGALTIMLGAYIDPRIALLAAPTTLLGIWSNSASSHRDIKIPWRAAGLHSTTLMCCFIPITAAMLLTLIFMSGNPIVLIPAIAIYGLLAAWHTLVALSAAVLVLINYDGRSK